MIELADVEKPPFALVVVTAGTSDPSSTRLLADRSAKRVVELAGRRDRAVVTHFIDLRELATEITTALVSPLVGPKLQQAIGARGDRRHHGTRSTPGRCDDRWQPGADYRIQHRLDGPQRAGHS
jgi:hypothetical protein